MIWNVSFNTLAYLSRVTPGYQLINILFFLHARPTLPTDALLGDSANLEVPPSLIKQQFVFLTEFLKGPKGIAAI